MGYNQGIKYKQPCGVVQPCKGKVDTGNPHIWQLEEIEKEREKKKKKERELRLTRCYTWRKKVKQRLRLVYGFACKVWKVRNVLGFILWNIQMCITNMCAHL